MSRKHILSFISRVSRPLHSAITTMVLIAVPPRTNRTTIVTINPGEENAIVQAITSSLLHKTYLITPEPFKTAQKIEICATELQSELNKANLTLKKLGYYRTLKNYALSSETFSTHAYLPGAAITKKRHHAHLTHGSGMKKELAYKTPITALYSVTDHFLLSQIHEYKLTNKVKIVREQPRLALLEYGKSNPEKIKYRLGLPGTKIALWAPTYRSHTKIRKSQRQLGLALSDRTILNQIIDIGRRFEAKGFQFIAKFHSIESGSLESFPFKVLTDDDITRAEISLYSVFGASDWVISDYSSIIEERKLYDLPTVTWQPDYALFSAGYRGFREGATHSVGLEDLQFRNMFFSELKIDETA